MRRGGISFLRIERKQGWKMYNMIFRGVLSLFCLIWTDIVDIEADFICLGWLIYTRKIGLSY